MFKGLRKKALLLSISLLPPPQDSNFDQILTQVRDFETALQAMDYLLDDRTKEGTDLLKRELKASADSDQPRAVFPLALGVMEFIEATLGFEPEVMNRAHETLLEAENASLTNAKYNVKHLLATSHIYPPGTEFQVTHAELTLLNALVMLLKENNGMMEQAKALFKLRRAYQTLDAIYRKIKELEPVFNRNLARFKKEAAQGLGSVSTVDLPGYKTPVSSAGLLALLPMDVRLMKDLEKVYQMRRARLEGTSLAPAGLKHAKNLFADSANLLLATLSRKGSNTFLDKLAVPLARPVSPAPQLQNAVFMNGTRNGAFSQNGTVINDSDSDDDDLFSDAQDSFEPSSSIYGKLADPTVGDTSDLILLTVSTNLLTVASGHAGDHLHVSTIDEFIHLGVQLCFGILQVVLLLIPPAIGKVLLIVGFRGDRETGLRMLWRTAITSRNIHGELALLCLLVFYDGPVQFVDVGFQLPHQADSAVDAVLDVASCLSLLEADLDRIMQNPNLYTPQVLKKARRLFPHNALWVLQEGRMLALQGHLHDAVDMMQEFTDNPANNIQMQQIEALLTFDRAMLYCFKHQFDEAARDFIRLVSINSWLQGVYLFFAGCCYLEKWRMINSGLEPVAKSEKAALLETYAKKAIHYINEGPAHVPGHGAKASNKKGGIGGGSKQMPFDKFLLRKMRHVEERQKQYPHLLLVQCFGTSPLHELIYFWNGYNRMTAPELELTLTLLGYLGAPGLKHSMNSDSKKYQEFPESTDEAMIRYFLQSVTLRLQGRVQEGLDLLENKVLSHYVHQDSPHAPLRFTKMSYSPYLYPTALYEKTMFVWLQKTALPDFEAHLAVQESLVWIRHAETVSDIGDYELSNRTSLRIKAAGDRLEQLGRV